MRKRIYERKFDWDEAKRLYDEETPVAWIAKKLRVTEQAVRRVVIPGQKEYMADYQRRASIGQGVCEDCGAPTNKVAQLHGSRWCRSCANKHMATSVRDGELRCMTCRRWLPDEEFHHASAARHRQRRGRRRECKLCANARRKEYRIRSRVLCKGGCGRMISPSDQRASAKFRHRKVFDEGYCPVCTRRRESGAAKFRKKFGTAADREDRTS